MTSSAPSESSSSTRSAHIRISPLLVDILRDRRDDYNGYFASLQTSRPNLKAADAYEAIISLVDPVVTRAATDTPGSERAIADGAIEVIFSSLAQRLLDPSGKDCALTFAWQLLFPSISSLMASEPKRVLAELSNAVVVMERIGRAQANSWVFRMVELAPLCANYDELRKLGQVLAWRSGAAHLRESALATADQLPDELRLRAVGITPGSLAETTYSRLRADRWFVADPYLGANEAGTIVMRVGSFRGMGGKFRVPPVLNARSGAPTDSDALAIVTCESESWFIQADANGATLHRASPPLASDSFADGLTSSPERSVPLSDQQAGWGPPAMFDMPSPTNIKNGFLYLGKNLVDLGSRGPITSSVDLGDVVAITNVYSHEVLFVRLRSIVR
jgi:hypothetical protein